MISFKLGAKKTEAAPKSESVVAVFQAEDEEPDDEAVVRGRIAPLVVGVGALKSDSEKNPYEDESEDEQSEEEKCVEVQEQIEKKEKQAGLIYKGGKKERPPSRYIEQLAQRSLKRELELEIVKERQLKRERENDDDIEEEEVFVTGAYKKRLQERKEYEEQLVKKDLQEALNDPRKKKDLTAFHQFMLSEGMASRSRAGQSSTTE